jgi:hypothetical protein
VDVEGAAGADDAGAGGAGAADGVTADAQPTTVKLAAAITATTPRRPSRDRFITL